MTPLEHNKYLGMAHLGYAGFQLLMTIVIVGFMGLMMSEIFVQARRMGGDTPPQFMGFVIVFAGVLQVLLSIPSIVAGYAFFKRRPWAKVSGVIAGVVAAMSFPIGTALAVYTFWFLFSDAGKQVYENLTPSAPPPPPSEWRNQTQSQDRAEPGMQPDWRG
jgi:hypothetical protein